MKYSFVDRKTHKWRYATNGKVVKLILTTFLNLFFHFSWRGSETKEAENHPFRISYFSGFGHLRFKGRIPQKGIKTKEREGHRHRWKKW